MVDDCCDSDVKDFAQTSDCIFLNELLAAVTQSEASYVFLRMRSI